MAALQSQPLPQGRRVAVVTNAGGPAIAAADAIAAHGLELADLAPATREALREMLPAEAAVANPVDMLPSALPETYRRALELVIADPGVDATVVITVTPIFVTPLEIAAAQAAVASPCKPVLSVFMTAPEFYREVREIDGMPPVYRFPESAVGALGAMVAYAEHRRKASCPAPASTRPVAVAALAGASLDEAGYVAAETAFAALGEAGIKVAPHGVAGTVEEIAEVAEQVGFPVVLKAIGPDLVHKTESGAVVLGLRDAGEVRAAAAHMQARLASTGVRGARFLVQAQVSGGREIILGSVRKPGFGQLVMCGLGGVAVEVFRDVSFRLAPLSEADAAEMVDSLVGARLLGPFRGRPAGDRAALVKALRSLADLAVMHPEIARARHQSTPGPRRRARLRRGGRPYSHRALGSCSEDSGALLAVHRGPWLRCSSLK